MKNINEIDIDEFAKLDIQTICLVDVREYYEFTEMRVPGAKLLPLGEVPENISSFPLDTPVYLICATGNRSGVAGEFLAEHNIETVNVLGGTKGWVMSGREYMHGDEGVVMFLEAG